MNNFDDSLVKGEYSPKELTKFLFVIALITLFSFWLHVSFGSKGLTDYLRYFMVVFFLVFGSFKLIGYKMFVEMFRGYDLLAKRVKFYSYAYPFIELALAATYLTNKFSADRDWLTLLVMGIGSIGVAEEIKKRSGIHCACLGNVIKLPLSTVSLVEDVGMGLMAVIMLTIR